MLKVSFLVTVARADGSVFEGRRREATEFCRDAHL